MNKENTQKLIDRLRSLPDKKVNMEGWFSEGGVEISPSYGGAQLNLEACHTAGCLAGWAVFIFATPEEKLALKEGTYTVRGLADDYLALTQEDEFCPYTSPQIYGRDSLKDITRQDVINYLEQRLAE